jgi:hypothetical protein
LSRTQPPSPGDANNFTHSSCDLALPAEEGWCETIHFRLIYDVEILIARSVVFSSTGTFVILYMAFRVCPVRMHAHSAGISSWVWNDHHLKEIMHQLSWSPYMQHMIWARGRVTSYDCSCLAYQFVWSHCEVQPLPSPSSWVRKQPQSFPRHLEFFFRQGLRRADHNKWSRVKR